MEHISSDIKFINSENIGEYAVIDSQRVHYVHKGEGEPLILVHTVGQSLYTWRKVIDILSESYHVFALDLMGHGYSSKPAGDYIISDHSLVISQFMDELNVASAHFCGFSMGAMYVLDFAIRFPERTGRICAISPGGITPTMPAFVKRLDSALLGRLNAWFINETMVSKMLTACYFDHTLLTESVIREYYLPFEETDARYAVQRCVMNFDDIDIINNLRDVESEVLIIWGNDDRIHEKEISEIFRQALKSSAMELIVNCGHIVHEEKPEKVCEFLLEFLENGLTVE